MARKPITCPSCGVLIYDTPEYIEMMIGKIKENLMEQWEKKKDFYMAKYPQRDYELQLRIMFNWIDNNRKVINRKWDYDLFIEDWLSRTKRSWDNLKVVDKPAIYKESTREEQLKNWKIRLAKQGAVVVVWKNSPDRYNFEKQILTTMARDYKEWLDDGDTI